MKELEGLLADRDVRGSASHKCTLEHRPFNLSRIPVCYCPLLLSQAQALKRERDMLKQREELTKVGYWRLWGFEFQLFG